MDNPLLVTIAIVILVLLIIVVALLLRRRPTAPVASGSVLTDDVARELLATLAASSAQRTGAPAEATNTSRDDRDSRSSAVADPDDIPSAHDSAASPADGSRSPRNTDDDGARQRAVAEAEAILAAASADAERRRSAAAAEAEAITRRANETAEGMRKAARAETEREREELQTELTAIRRRAEADGRRALEREIAAAQSERVEIDAAKESVREATRRIQEESRRLESDRLSAATTKAEAEAMTRVNSERESNLAAELARLTELKRELTQRAEELEVRLTEHERELERVSGMTAEEARTELLSRMEEQVRREAAMMGRRIEAEAEATAKQRARAIVADAVQRVASDQTSQSVVSVVHLPAEEIKGRIIGREGRNIRTFETVTGVNVIIDDTPEAVLLSCFDPVRREIGRVTLQSLIDDGRIHPHRIEEAYERAHDEVEALCRRAAEDALIAVGIPELHPELMTLLGHLKYRTSYGQNVLGHMVETAHIARGMAYELGVDPAVLVRGAFLHDIGKAVTHEARGSHAAVGAELARHYGESDEVAHCIEAHHDEVPPATVEAVLTQAADACSGGRPGARRESLESYVQRMERIEAIAGAKKGVEKVFAMQAGRELRVMVKPEIVDDIEAHLIAREVAKQIEEELTYPGQVRVTVIRESRATEIAR